MRIKNSLFTRRQFLNGLLGGGVAVLASSLLYPIIRFVFPPYQEPEKVLLPLGDYQGLAPGSVKSFAWGAKPGFIKKKTDGSYLALVGVCTHLDCNVTYLPDQKKFFCACHTGWYDENGINIGGPPPRPLRTLTVVVEGENLVVKKEGVT